MSSALNCIVLVIFQKSQLHFLNFNLEVDTESVKMLDLCTWRVRIGGFHASLIPGRSSKRSDKNTNLSNDFPVQEASVSDVLLTYILLCTVVCFGFTASSTIMTAIFSPFCIPNSFFILLRGTSSVADVYETKCDSPLYFDFVVNSAFSLELVLLQLFSTRRLLLSGDIETNPGPVDHKDDTSVTETRTDYESKVFEKIASLEVSLQKQMSNVLSAVESQTNSLKQLADSLKQLEEDQKLIRSTLSKFAEDIAETKKWAQQNKDKIEDIANKQDEIEFVTSALENDIDRLEGFSRRNNVKFFGVPETEGEENCEETIRDLLKAYVPQKNWSEDVIERAHRLGRRDPRNSKPRPLIAKFLRWSDAMTIMRDRDIRSDMEADGLRVAQDITRRQSAKLKELRSEGKIGYFVNGQLRIKDATTDRRSTPRASPRRDVTRDATPSTSTSTTRSPSVRVSDRPAVVTTRACSSPRHTEAGPVQSQPRARTRSTVADTHQRQPSVREAWSRKNTRSQEQQK